MPVFGKEATAKTTSSCSDVGAFHDGNAGAWRPLWVSRKKVRGGYTCDATTDNDYISWRR